MKLKSLLLGAVVLFAINIQFTRCTKLDPTDIGADLLPPIDNITTFDTTLRVYANNYLSQDSTRVGLWETHTLGLIDDDPVFGKTEASIYLSLVPNSTNRNPFFSLDSIVGIDSAILSLPYAGAVFGDSNSVQKISVFEISDADFTDSVGYPVSRPHFSTVGSDLAGSLVNFSQFDDEKLVVVKSDTQRVNNVLRLPIDPGIGLRFAGYDTSTVYLSTGRDSAFQKAFNGLAIRVDGSGSPSSNALAFFNPGGQNAKLTFYFRVMRNGVVDTLTTDLVPYYTSANTGAGYGANLIHRTPEHEYANLSTTTPIENPEKLLIQSAPGSYAIVKVPGLSDIPNSIIHRAELSFTPASSSGSDIYASPDLFFLDVIDSANNRFVTIREDFYFTNMQTLQYDIRNFGGFLSNNKYGFNLTRYVQGLVTRGNDNYSFRLYAPQHTTVHYAAPGSQTVGGRFVIPVNSQVAKGRAVIFGGGEQPGSMVLRIIYSKI